MSEILNGYLSNDLQSLLVIFYILLIVIFVSIIININGYFSNKKNHYLSIIKKNDLEYVNNKSGIEYTLFLLDFIKNITSQVCVIKFHEFKDRVDFKKINEKIVKQLIEDIALNVHENMNWDNINIEKSILTRNFYYNYIIDTAMIIIKELIERTINTITE